MDHLQLRREAIRFSRLAQDCSDARVRQQLELLAQARIAQAIEAERGRNYLPTLARLATWVAVMAAVFAAGAWALATWYQPHPREIVVSVEPHLHSQTASPSGTADRRVGSAEHDHLVTSLENRPLER